MKKIIIEFLFNLMIILLFSYGFQSGLEWHRVLACILGGVLLGLKKL